MSDKKPDPFWNVTRAEASFGYSVEPQGRSEANKPDGKLDAEAKITELPSIRLDGDTSLKAVPVWDSRRDYFEDPLTTDEMRALAFEIGKCRKSLDAIPIKLFQMLRDSYSILGPGLAQVDIFTIEAALDLVSRKTGPLQVSLKPVATDDKERADFYDLLRELDHHLSLMVREIRSVNDPQILDARLRTARAHFDSLRQFLDIDGQAPPDDIPREIPRRARSLLKDIPWLKISDNAQKWANTLMKLFEKLPW